MAEKKASDQDQVPQIPLVARATNAASPIDPTGVTSGFTMLVNRPAFATLSALSTRQNGQAAEKNQLGTKWPQAVMIGVDATNTYLYIIPVRSETPGATKVRYEGSRASFSLYKTFRDLERLVPAGRNHFYTIHPTPGEATIDSVTGWGLYTKLSEVNDQAAKQLSEEEKARRNAKRQETIRAKKKKAQEAREAHDAGNDSASAAQSPPPADSDTQQEH